MIAQTKLKEVLHYNTESGVFTRLVSTSRGVKVGSIAGTLSHTGYIHIKIDGKKYLAHRLAWLYVHGVWPENEIDHKNMIRSDNRLINLREATQSENNRNRNKQKNNTSGVKGVYWYKKTGKWCARIGIDGKPRHIGYYNDIEDAAEAYKTVEKLVAGEFYRS